MTVLVLIGLLAHAWQMGVCDDGSPVYGGLLRPPLGSPPGWLLENSP